MDGRESPSYFDSNLVAPSMPPDYGRFTKASEKLAQRLSKDFRNDRNFRINTSRNRCSITIQVLTRLFFNRLQLTSQSPSLANFVWLPKCSPNCLPLGCSAWLPLPELKKKMTKSTHCMRSSGRIWKAKIWASAPPRECASWSVSSMLQYLW